MMSQKIKFCLNSNKLILLGVSNDIIGNTDVVKVRQANLVWYSSQYVTLPYKGYSSANDGIMIPMISNLGLILLIATNYSVAYQGWFVVSNLASNVSGLQITRDSNTSTLRISITTSSHDYATYFYVPYFMYFAINNSHINEYLSMPFGVY